MPDQKHVAPTFVNTLVVHGFLNGVLNLAFTSAHWFPQVRQDETIAVAVDEPITVDLRMDLACAQQLRDALDKIIETNSKTGTVN